MKDLNDKDFDQLFKDRITAEIPDFEEESWSKMEKKLQKRDRAIFLRYAAVLLLLLSFGLMTYVMQQKNTDHAPILAGKPKIQTKPNQSAPSSDHVISRTDGENDTQLAAHTPVLHTRPQLQLEGSSLADLTPEPDYQPQLHFTASPPLMGNIGTGQLQIIIKEMAIAPKQTPIEEVADPKPIKKTSKRFPISLALAAGPDFNSTTSAIGGKTNVAIGLGIGVGITRKLSLQTGINYGHKNYDADAYNYTFNNPNTKNTIAEVNASCKVIEIPLRASLNVSDNKKRSIDVNAGLSSYLMLKEDYVYKYTPESGRSDRLVEAVNENQHILSVVDLSATYNIKLNQKLAFGIEPYVKIPISGIGVGSVPLKSSGIALKLRYDFNKN